MLKEWVKTYFVLRSERRRCHCPGPTLWSFVRLEVVLTSLLPLHFGLLVPDPTGLAQYAFCMTFMEEDLTCLHHVGSHSTQPTFVTQ